MNKYEYICIAFVFFAIIQAQVIAEVEVVKIFVAPKQEDTTTSHVVDKGSKMVVTKTVVETVEATGSSARLVTADTSITLGTTQTASAEICSGAYLNECNNTFALEILEVHNEKRALHGAQKLSWNDTVYEYAAQYASKYDCSGKLVHSGGSYGENLAIGYTVVGGANAWYDEGDTYVYGSESTYNHFTAMIWNSSYAVGCAYKYCNAVWGTYIICSYYPAGNVIGQCSKNVFPLL